VSPREKYEQAIKEFSS